MEFDKQLQRFQAASDESIKNVESQAQVQIKQLESVIQSISKEMEQAHRDKTQLTDSSQQQLNDL